MAVHAVGCRGGEEYDGAPQGVGSAPPSGRYMVGNRTVALLVGDDRRRTVGRHIAGRNGVDLNSLACPFMEAKLTIVPLPLSIICLPANWDKMDTEFRLRPMREVRLLSSMLDSCYVSFEHGKLQ
jgi:hypothetical protein